MNDFADRLDPESVIPAMPDDLAAAVDALSVAGRRKALRNWKAIGEDGRHQYVQYLNRAHRHRTRAERCEEAALQLTDPGTGFPWRMGKSVGGMWGVL
jgi:hypothetical protein